MPDEPTQKSTRIAALLRRPATEPATNPPKPKKPYTDPHNLLNGRKHAPQLAEYRPTPDTSDGSIIPTGTIRAEAQRMEDEAAKQRSHRRAIKRERQRTRANANENQR